MTTSALKAATQISIGAESSRGSTVARTRRIMTRGATWREIVEQEVFEDHMHGTLARAVLAPVPTRHHTELEIAMDMDFETILLALLGGIDGAVTPSTPGSGEGRLWTFTPSVTVAVDPKTYSMEWVESNFGSSPDDLGKLSLYGFCTGFDIEAGIDGLTTLTLRMAGRKVASVSKTSISIPTTNYAANAKWKLNIDDSWANLGNTQITAQVYGFKYSFGGFLRPAYYLDGRADLDFVTHEFGPRTADLTVDVVVDPASTGFVTLEEVDKAAQTKRFVKMLLSGAAFANPDQAFDYEVNLDGAYQHAPDSMQDRGTDRDGNAITRMHFMSVYDSVSSQDVQWLVRNILTAFP